MVPFSKPGYVFLVHILNKGRVLNILFYKYSGRFSIARKKHTPLGGVQVVPTLMITTSGGPQKMNSANTKPLSGFSISQIFREFLRASVAS